MKKSASSRTTLPQQAKVQFANLVLTEGILKHPEKRDQSILLALFNGSISVENASRLLQDRDFSPELLKFAGELPDSLKEKIPELYPLLGKGTIKDFPTLLEASAVLAYAEDDGNKCAYSLLSTIPHAHANRLLSMLYNSCHIDESRFQMLAEDDIFAATDNVDTLSQHPDLMRYTSSNPPRSPSSVPPSERPTMVDPISTEPTRS